MILFLKTYLKLSEPEVQALALALAAVDSHQSFSRSSSSPARSAVGGDRKKIAAGVNGR